MHLASNDGRSFRLSIAGYQFPARRADGPKDWDANWLRIRIEAAVSDGRWSLIFPCMTTWDAAGLADWLEGFARGMGPDERLGFTEPNLAFEVRTDPGQRRVMRVYFELECRPPWAASRVVGADEFWIEFPLAELDLLSAAGALRAQLQHFPPRG